MFAGNSGVQKQPQSILRTSILTSLSPDKLLFDQHSLFINTPSSKDSWYKGLVTVHPLMGRKYHCVNMNSSLSASLVLPQSRQQKLQNLQGLTNQDTTLLYVKNLAYKLSKNKRGRTFLCLLLMSHRISLLLLFSFQYDLPSPLRLCFK